MPKTVADLVAEARSHIENLSADQVQVEMERGATIVDIREPNERAATGAIPGSVAVPRGMLEWVADSSSSYHDPVFQPHSRLILHCAGGGRSALAVEALKELGFTNVAHLDTGMTGWIAAGKPVSKDQPD